MEKKEVRPTPKLSELSKEISFLNDRKEDNVNHPEHYTWLKEKAGVEVIEITRHLDFDRGNAIKYILRCGIKEEGDIDKAIEDIEKAIWYLNDYKENFLMPYAETFNYSLREDEQEDR